MIANQQKESNEKFEKVIIDGEEWEVISRYTRKQAIEDGVLVDLTKLFPNDTRIFKYPVACTSAVWSIIESACNYTREDLGAYVWDLCWMSNKPLAIVKDEGHERLFKCQIPLGTREQLFKIHIGGGDALEPVITIMLPDED